MAFDSSVTAADAAAVRQNLRLLASDQLSQKDQPQGRTEVLPVQWRKHLNLDVSVLKIIPRNY